MGLINDYKYDLDPKQRATEGYEYKPIPPSNPPDTEVAPAVPPTTTVNDVPPLYNTAAVPEPVGYKSSDLVSDTQLLYGYSTPQPFTDDYDTVDVESLGYTPPVNDPNIQEYDAEEFYLERARQQQRVPLGQPLRTEPYYIEQDNQVHDMLLRSIHKKPEVAVDNEQIKIATQVEQNPIKNGSVEGVITDRTSGEEQAFDPLGGYRVWMESVKENPLNIIKAPFVIYSDKNKFGDYGKGAWGFAMYGLDVIENAASAVANDVHDVVTGKKDVKQVLEQPRVTQAIKGKDYSILNESSEERPLGFIGSKDVPETIGEGKDRSIAGRALWRILENTPGGVLIEEAAKAIGVLEGGDDRGLGEKLIDAINPFDDFGEDEKKRDAAREETKINVAEENEGAVGRAIQVAEGLLAFGGLIASPIITGFGLAAGAAGKVDDLVKGVKNARKAIKGTAQVTDDIGKQASKVLDDIQPTNETLLDFGAEVDVVRRSDTDLIALGKLNGDIDPNTPVSEIDVNRLLDMGYERYGQPVNPSNAEPLVEVPLDRPAETITQAVEEGIEDINKLSNPENLTPEEIVNASRRLEANTNKALNPQTVDELNAVLPENLRGTSETWKDSATFYIDQQKKFDDISMELAEIDLKRKKQLAKVQDHTEVFDPLPNGATRRPVSPKADAETYYPRPTEILPATPEAKVINEKTWYHGTIFDDVDLQNSDPLIGSARHELGVGHYLTDDPGKAAIYSKATPHDNVPNFGNRNLGELRKGNVYGAKLDIANPINATKALPEDGVNAVRIAIAESRALEPFQIQLLKVLEDSTPYNRMFDRFDEVLERVSETEKLSLQRKIAENLRLSGYDSIVDGDTLVLLGHDKTNKITELVELGRTSAGDEVAKAMERYNANLLLKRKYPDSTFADVTAKESLLELQIRQARKLDDLYKIANEKAKVQGRQLADAVHKLELAAENDSQKAYDEIQSLWNKVDNSIRESDEIPYPSSIRDRYKNAALRVRKSKQLYGNREAELVSLAAEKQALVDDVFAGSVAKINTLNPKAKGNLSNFLANRFNLKTKSLGLSPNINDLSEGGALRQVFIDNPRQARGLVELVVKQRGAEQVENFVESVRALSKKNGVVKLMKNKGGELDEFVQKAIEVGSIPARNSGNSLHTAGRAYNLRRYEQFVSAAKGLGFSDDSVAEIIRGSSRISAVMDETRALAISMGADIGDTEGLGYFMRVMTPDAKRFIQTARQEAEGFQEITRGGVGSVKAAHDVSRSTFNYVPEDLALLAKKLDTDVDDLADKIVDGRLLVDEIKKLDDVSLDELVDSGLLSKVPMTTDEVFNYVKSKYNLPMKQLDEVFVTNPQKAFELYTQSLSDTVSKSAIGKTLLDNGVQKGWLLSDEAFTSLSKTDPGVYSSKTWKRLTPEQLKVIYPAYRAEDGAKYIQKVVDDAIKSVTDVSASPSKMGTLAQAADYWRGFLTQSLLLSPQYAMRILYSTFIQLGAAGGDLGRFLPSSIDVMKVQKHGIKALDNTKKVFRVDGEMLTKQQLYKRFIMKSPTNLAPRTADVKVGERFGNIFGAKRGANYLLNYAQEYGGLKAIGYAGEMAQRAQGNFFAPIANTANFFEVSGKWAVLQELTDPKLNAGQLISSLGQRRKIHNLDEAIAHIDDYFFMGDETGSAVKTVSKLVPFASYLFQNPTAQIRNLMRNPKPFVNYIRLRSFVNRDAASDENFIEAEVPNYILDNAPLFPVKDADGNWLALITRTFDPVIDGVVTVNEVGQSLLGGFYGTAKDKRDQQMNKGGVSKFIQDVFRKSHPMYQSIVSLLTGRDEYGRELAEVNQEPYLGVKMPPIMRHILEGYAPLNQLNRWNPFDVFGSPEITDPASGMTIREGTESFAGEARKKDSQLSKYSGGKKQFFIRVSGMLGFNVKVIDKVRGTQYSLGDMKRDVRELKRLEGKARNEIILDKNKDSKEYERNRQEYNELLGKRVRFEYEYLRLKAWANRNGIPEEAVLDKYFKKKLSKSNIDVISPEKRQSLLRDAMKDYIE